MKELVLASQSPRRKELLEKIVPSFILDPADVDEFIDNTKDLKEEIKRLAQKKASAVLERHPNAVVIGSDTIVVVDQEVLGKPKDENDAKCMLRKLSGRAHEVMTGLCVMSNKKTFVDVSISKVTFANMTDDEIDAYIATKECDDKAGAYAIQGYGGKYIESIEGDYYTIMGLPLNMLYEEFKNIEEY